MVVAVLWHFELRVGGWVGKRRGGGRMVGAGSFVPG